MGLVGKARDLIAWNRLGLSMSRAKGAIVADAQKAGYDPAIGAKKAAFAFVQYAAYAAMGAVLVASQDTSAVAAALAAADIEPETAGLVAAAIGALARFISNRRKHS